MSEDQFQDTMSQLSEGERLFAEVRTLEQGRAYILEIVSHVEQARDLCDVIIPGDREATVKHQRKAYRSWMIRYGQALGALTTLMHCRVLNDVAYAELRGRILATGEPTIVGAM